MTNKTKWDLHLSKIGLAVSRLISQIGHAPTRIVCDMPDGRWAVIISPNDSEYHIFIVDKEELDRD